MVCKLWSSLLYSCCNCQKQREMMNNHHLMRRDLSRLYLCPLLSYLSTISFSTNILLKEISFNYLKQVHTMPGKEETSICFLFLCFFNLPDFESEFKLTFLQVYKDMLSFKFLVHLGIHPVDKWIQIFVSIWWPLS